MPSEFTRELIEGLEIDPNKPLIISDADEVIFELFTHLFAYYLEHGYEFRGSDIYGFEIMNHLYDINNQQRIDEHTFQEIITNFFIEHAKDVPFVAGAYEHLMALSEYCQIVILTNAPHEYRDRRVELYAKQGLHFPIVTNLNNKVGAIKLMTKDHQDHVFFIDDSPEHHDAVLDETDHVHCIHFIGCKKYAQYVQSVDHAHFSSTDWHEVKTYIDGILKG